MIDIPNVIATFGEGHGGGRDSEFDDPPVEIPYKMRQVEFRVASDDRGNAVIELPHGMLNHRMRTIYFNWTDFDNSPDQPNPAKRKNLSKFIAEHGFDKDVPYDPDDRENLVYSPNLYNGINRSRLKQFVDAHRLNNDITYECKTYVLIVKFIRELRINIRTTKIRDNETSKVIVGLKQHVVLPLENIVRESIESFKLTKFILLDYHSYSFLFRGASGWSLWASIYWYLASLPSIGDKAKSDDNYSLSLVLDDVAKQIERILYFDGWEHSRGNKIVMEAAVAEEQAAPTTVMQEEPIRIIRQRCDAILKWLKDNDYDPQNLPPPLKKGLPTIKAPCSEELCKNKKMFSSKGLFEKAWQQLRDDGEIKELK